MDCKQQREGNSNVNVHAQRRRDPACLRLNREGDRNQFSGGDRNDIYQGRRIKLLVVQLRQHAQLGHRHD
jgi:hypothetical protein